MSIFEQFEIGKLYFDGRVVDLAAIEWTMHATFAGVALKHLITGADTAGVFSYHLVKVDPGKAIGLHSHATQLETHEVVAGFGVCRTDGFEYTYEPGVIGIMPIGIAHEVLAGDEGVYLLAKFIPPLL